MEGPRGRDRLWICSRSSRKRTRQSSTRREGLVSPFTRQKMVRGPWEQLRRRIRRWLVPGSGWTEWGHQHDGPTGRRLHEKEGGREKHSALARTRGRGEQDMPPNVPLWQANCLEEKALEKRFPQGRRPDLAPWKWGPLSHVKGAFPAPGRQKASSSLETGLRPEGRVDEPRRVLTDSPARAQTRSLLRPSTDFLSPCRTDVKAASSLL